MRAAIAFVAVVVQATLSGVVAEQCPSYDVLDKTVYLPHPYDCTLFSRCVAGQPVLGRCPPGQHFNPASRACDSPAQARCTAKPNTCSTLGPESTCPYQCTCRRNHKHDTCPPNLQFGAEFNVIDVTLDPGCDKETNYFMLRGNKLGYLSVRNASAAISACDASQKDSITPHFGDCSKGTRCENGQDSTLTCPSGYLFSAEFGYCEEPQYVNCSTASGLPASTDCPKGAAISTCYHDCACNVLQGVCPAQLKFTSTINIFDARTQLACMKGPTIIDLGDQFFGSIEIHPNTTKVNHCPTNLQAKPVFLADPTNCERVVKCDRGKERSIYCPNHEHYNPKTKRCGKPDPAVCKPVSPINTQPSTPATPVALGNIPCPSAVACPSGSVSRVAHLTDCSLFCQCTQGASTLVACPSGQHFNAQTQACDSPDKARCQTFCGSLAAAAGGSWSPQSCSAGNSKEGAECRLQCSGKYTLVGSDVVRCTNKGWHGTGGLNIIPACKTSQQIAVDMVNVVATTLNQSADAALLFVLDESGSISTSNFQIEKNFVDAMVNAFPLSQNRPAGVITFSDPAATIDISLSETSTCNFLSKLRNIMYSGGGTNIANALNVATGQINAFAPNKKTLVFAISDGRSQTDPVAAARNLRSVDRILFTIGVAGYDRQQLETISSTHKDGTKLFFGLPNFEVFSVVSEYLKTHYNKGAAYNCP